MSMMPALSDEELSPEAAAVFADIRATRQTDFVNNFWRVLAHDPVALKRTWESIRQVMAPSALDPLTKELLYVAVSMANNCEYCIRSHSAAARAKGMTDQQFMELVAVVGMAAETNRIATALQVPVDAAFRPATDTPFNQV
jgi:AhpD family alkylhydroperoxidase